MPKKAKALKLEKPSKSDKKSEKKKSKKEARPAPHADEVGRLNRVAGQINGIAGMLEKGRDLNDVLTQFKAVHSALRSVEARVFDTYVNDSIDDISGAIKRKEREAKVVELKNLLTKG